MRSLAVSILALLILLGETIPVHSAQADTYRDTHHLLSKMGVMYVDGPLRKLFETADLRDQDLVRALDDPDEEIRLNAQTIIFLVAEPTSLSALRHWQAKKERARSNDRMYVLEYVESERFVHSSKRRLADTVKKVLYNRPNLSARLAAFNPRLGMALVEVTQRTTGGFECMYNWRVVLRLEGERWRIVSNQLTWAT